ncbi:hypothetical protein [Gordonia neofelifaecis]|uniref:Uncharacterized protein n=1 Tax=Gordonia neofelifaecis NRRL B-59395 TaxID=644548 RepID=F1YF57_9ACTN|nr:hypothetical protein [Gordonia neofelifaecis]EGD56425.1 hypothetical protein SCNU_02692 [Gordonia neofelifaecis NRRL B-59395]
MSELVYVRELWQKRADVAQECADELGELGYALGAVLSRNYFGNGCDEGAALFERLRNVIDNGMADLQDGSRSAAELSRVAQQAGPVLHEADSAGAERID